MATRIRFNAPAHHKLEVGDVVIYGGKSAVIEDDEQAQELADADWTDVMILPSGRTTWPKTHAKLDELAEQLEVTWPTPAEGVEPNLTTAEKIATLEAAGYSPDGTRQGDATELDSTDDGEDIASDDDPKEE